MNDFRKLDYHHGNVRWRRNYSKCNNAQSSVDESVIPYTYLKVDSVDAIPTKYYNISSAFTLVLISMGIGFLTNIGLGFESACFR